MKSLSGHAKKTMSLLSENVRRVLSESIRYSQAARPLRRGCECPRRPEEENKSSSGRLAILAAASRVRCAALRDFGVAKQSLPKEERERGHFA